MSTRTQTLTTERRLSILSSEELADIYDLPVFDAEERDVYFTLSSQEARCLQDLHTLKSRVIFCLQLGYFKAKQLFFSFDLAEVAEDLQHILDRYFVGQVLSNTKPLNKRTRLKQQRLILDLCSYRACQQEERELIEQKARDLARSLVKPNTLFRELLRFLEDQGICLPGYSSMQNMIAAALGFEQQRLGAILGATLTPEDRQALQGLLNNPDGFYSLTLLKRQPKDFSLSAIKQELKRNAQLAVLYPRSEIVLDQLAIPAETIKYYASLASYYSVYKLERFKPSVTWLYLLCFVYHRYRRLQDNLIGSLLHNVRRFNDEAKEMAEAKVYAFKLQGNQNLPKAGRVLRLFTDVAIPGTTPFASVQARAFKILEAEQIEHVASHISTKARFDEKAFVWEHIDTLERQFKRHLRPGVTSITFEASRKQHPLLDALAFLKTVFETKKPLSQRPEHDFPLAFASKQQRRYLYADQKGKKGFKADRYEYLVYQQLHAKLVAAELYCRDSNRYRSFKDDLVDDDTWQNKTVLLAEAGLDHLSRPVDAQLDELEQLLEAKLLAVNERLETGDNPFVELKKQGRAERWTFQQAAAKEDINHPFFNRVKQLDMSSVLHFVDNECGVFRVFEHVLGRFAKQGASGRALTAALTAWGTNMGLGRMSSISDISYQELVATSQNFLRSETLREANDLISNATKDLPIFDHFSVDEQLHSSSDGQKFETRLHTLRSRYSPKYFGLKKGMVDYTTIVNHVPVNARIITANEHESHFVLDALLTNSSDLKPEVHSTDNHGTNQVNFALLDVFGYKFAPRYKDMHRQLSSSLYGFKHPSHYEGLLLKPVRKLNKHLITEEWENLQRIYLSLALGTTNQHIIVAKLSSFARRNKTQRALWEYDNIFKSLYLLDYVDSRTLRRNVNKVLNRGESYHRLRRAISFANYGKLRFRTEDEQQLWADCSRLLSNCIIYYNCRLLSACLQQLEQEGKQQALGQLVKLSPVAWQHVNFYGRYTFTKTPQAVYPEQLAAGLIEEKLLG